MLEFSGGITVLTTVLGVSAPANAIIFNTYTDRATWEAAVGGSFSEEDFNSTTQRTFSDPINESGFNGFNLSGSLEGDTVQIAAGTTTSNLNGTQFLNWQGSDVGPAITFNFDSPVSAFGFDWSDTDSTDTYTLTIPDDGSTFSSTPFYDRNEGPNSNGRGSGFFGIVASDDTFNSASFVSTAQGGVVQPFGVDNVAFSSSSASVPFEFSPTLGLFAVGSIWSVSRLRKRMAAGKITE